MAQKGNGFYKGYASDAADQPETTSTLVDSERDYPIEGRCCITGDEVDHSYCRYPDTTQGTMMVMSHQTMLQYSRQNQSLSVEFERVLELRRQQEKRKR